MKQVSPKRSLRSSRAERRGSTLLVVLALLGLLALLGFTFYTFAAQERAAAAHPERRAALELGLQAPMAELSDILGVL